MAVEKHRFESRQSLIFFETAFSEISSIVVLPRGSARLWPHLIHMVKNIIHFIHYRNM